jgi:hypothetical protein
MNTISNPRDAGANQREFPARQLDSRPVFCDDETTEVSFAEQGREGREPGKPRSSRAFSCDCADLVHELANTTTAVLMNAQVLGWRLPPYSRLKRPLREIERNAQRGGELMKRLLSHLATEAAGQPDHTVCADYGLGVNRLLSQAAGETTDPPDYVPADIANQRMDTVTAQESGVDSGTTVILPPRMSTRRLLFFAHGRRLNSHQHVTLALARFPKRDDGNEYGNPNQFGAAAWGRARRRRDVPRACR